MILKHFFLFLILFSNVFNHAFAEQDFLPPEQAFTIQPTKVMTTAEGNAVIVSWKVAKGYYVYRDKVKFTSNDETLTLGDIKLSASESKNDPFFGQIEIFKKEFSATIPFSSNKKEGELLFLTAKSQGCAEAGICYPPLKQSVSFTQKKTANIETQAISTDNNALDNLTQLGNLGANNSIQEDEVLSNDDAFKLLLSLNKDNQLSAIWSIAENHYLYKNKVKFELIEGNGFTLVQPKLPKGKAKHDEYLGDYEAYYRDLNVILPIIGSGDKSKPLAVKVSYQGCSEAGICYPKVTKNIELDISTTNSNNAVTTLSNTVLETTNKTEEVQSEQDALAGLLSSDNTFIALLTFFIIGLGLAFTPCVFPMIPILSGIIAGQGDKASSSAFVMSVVYVLSMAVVYTLVGVVAGLSGNNIQILFQNPWVLGSFSLIFVLLAFSMFGFYELQLPSSLQSKISELSNKQEGGTLIGVAIMGVLSALIVGPCMAPPLMGILLFISQTGDPILGGSALFVMSLGMGIPLVVIGTSAGKLMPRAGMWMNTVKAVFGVAMLAIAIWMLERVLPATVIMWLWALLIFTSGVYMGALTPIKDKASGWSLLWKSLGLILMLYASVLIIGASSGHTDYLQPLKGHTSSVSTSNTVAQHINFEKIKSLADLKKKLAIAQDNNQPVMLDFYADWCTYCKSLENTTFKDPEVLSSLDNFIVLQADVTDMDKSDDELLKSFQIPAPPAILFFMPGADEARNFRVVGYKNGADFAQHIQSFSLKGQNK